MSREDEGSSRNMTSLRPASPRQESNSTEEKDEPTSRPGPLQLLFSRQSSKRSRTRGSLVEIEASEIEQLPSPSGSAQDAVETPTRSKSKKFTGFASRSVRKSQWRLFKHRTFFGSRNSTKNKNQLQLPRLTLRHPSVDGTAMPLAIDGDGSSLLAIRSTQRRWTESESAATRKIALLTVGNSKKKPGRLGSHDSATSSGYDGSQDLELPQAMTAPVSPNVPLSAGGPNEILKNNGKALFKFRSNRLAYVAGLSHNSSTSSSTDSAWKSLDSQTWRNSLDEKEVILRGAHLQSISDTERAALQVIANNTLMMVFPGINLKKPIAVSKQKRMKFTKASRTLTGDARRTSGSTTSIVEKRVFGISLVDCMLNDRRLDMETRCRSLDDSSASHIPRSSSQRSACVGKALRTEPEIVAAIDESKRWLYPRTMHTYYSVSSHPPSPSPLVGSAPPTCSLPVKEPAPTTANHLETTGRFIKKQRPSASSFSNSLDGTEDIDPHQLRIPRIVENCIQFIMAYGMDSIGLFRIAGNNRRSRKLRKALEENGGRLTMEMDLVETLNPHDVADVLKEYLRDLPQSILPPEHYQAYVIAGRFRSFEERIECLRFLLALLPPTSLDTLFYLLKFLQAVTEHATFINDKGERVIGNRMDPPNLAVVFTPCFLRPEPDVPTIHDTESCISIVATLLENTDEIFRIPTELQCQVFSKIREMEPSRLDRLLDGIARSEGYIDHPLCSPFPATMEEDLSFIEMLQAEKSSSRSRESSRTTQNLQTAAAAARRRLRGVVATAVSAFRFSSVTRSTPDMSLSSIKL